MTAHPARWPDVTGLDAGTVFASMAATIPDDHTYDIDPATAELDNTVRAQRIAKVLLATNTCSAPEDPETVIQDVLADLRHLCDALGLDFGLVDSRAYSHYAAELHGVL